MSIWGSAPDSPRLCLAPGFPAWSFLLGARALRLACRHHLLRFACRFLVAGRAGPALCRRAGWFILFALLHKGEAVAQVFPEGLGLLQMLFCLAFVMFDLVHDLVDG